MVKRISLIVVCTAIAFFAFSFYSESKADKEENEEKEEEVDFQNIPLTSKQLNAIDLKLGEAQKRELDAMLHVNGTLVLSPEYGRRRFFDWRCSQIHLCERRTTDQ